MNQPDIEPDFEAARLTVRLGAVADNYRTFRRLAGPAAVASVVKGDGYGLGAARIAPALAEAGCDSFFVARLAEAIKLRQTLPQARIFVLDGAAPDAVPALLSHNLIPVLNSLADIASWQAAANATDQILEAVVHVDTGMSRLGLPSYELSVLAAEAKKRLAGLNLVLVMSQLACADEPDAAMNREQLSRFRQALAMLPPAPASLAASAGILLGPDYHFDLVRPGVGLYGAHPRGLKTDNPMKTVAFLTGKVLQVRRIDVGECVGYGASFSARKPLLLATLALGYADGLVRAASNRGVAAFCGKLVPFVGRISMDLVTVNVTDLAVEPRAGDEMELLGDSVSLEMLAEAAGTNAYEILNSLGRRVPRHYLESAQ
ncbi:MAG TPA: alanine racemase [Rhizomicrobium sp.]|nr:alanine racemase [Rhizomicrobium sp.]